MQALGATPKYAVYAVTLLGLTIVIQSLVVTVKKTYNAPKPDTRVCKTVTVPEYQDI